MIGNEQKVTEEIDASGWLAAFAESPKQAVNDLLWDTFYFGPLNLTDRGQLLAGWLDRLGDSESFAERLDSELTRWVLDNWGWFGRRAEFLVSAWSCLCSVVEFSAKLPEESRLRSCARVLRSGFDDRQRFLGSFSSAPTADPLGVYLAAVAEFQGEDRTLAPFWHWMCELPDGVPYYHARYAMLGLRRLKRADSSQNGTLRAEIVFGLLRLAQAFDRLTRERGLRNDIARNTFLRIAGQTAAAYRDSPRWSEHGLNQVLLLPDRPQRWVLEAVQPLAEAVHHANGRFAARRGRVDKSIEYDRSWSQRAADASTRLKSGDVECLPDVERLLDEERRYAERTGDSHPLVLSLCRFASSSLRFSSDVALRWANEAREWEPNNAFTWTTIKDVLLSRGDIEAALYFAWVAWKRFPENVVVRTGLAEALKKANRYFEAEEIYRQTIREFPESVFALTGLSDILKSLRRYNEAEEVYRKTIEKFPNNVVARTGLAEVLKTLRQYDNAEKVYRETIEMFPDNEVARGGLADTLRRAGAWEEAEKEFRHTVELGHRSPAIFVQLGYMVLRRGEEGRAEALQLANQALQLDPTHRYALRLKEQLQTYNDINLTDAIEEWDKVADSLSETPAFTPSTEYDFWASEDETARREQLQSATNQTSTNEAITPSVKDELTGEVSSVEPQRSIEQTGVEEAREPAQLSEDKVADTSEIESLQATKQMRTSLQHMVTKRTESARPTENKPPEKHDQEKVVELQQPPQTSIQEPSIREAGDVARLKESESIDEGEVQSPPETEQPQTLIRITSGETDDFQQSEDQQTEEGLKTEPPQVLSEPSESLRVEPFAQPSPMQPQYLTLSDSVKVSALTAEAYFYRTWARETSNADLNAYRRLKATTLISMADQLAPQDPQVIAEMLALSMDQEEDSVVRETLKVKLTSHSAAAPLLVLKARLDRATARKEKHLWNDSALTDLCAAPHRLRNLNSALTPLFHFQKGLAALSLRDGAVRIRTAADAFTTFRQTLARRAAEERDDLKGSHDQTTGQFYGFHDWLRVQVGNKVFKGAEQVEQVTVGETEIRDLESNWEERKFVLEEVENVFVDRLMLATL